ncbi:MAG: hypothetical protein JEZ06_12025 [Anaerolineaceae bacterium]|nr:hypothetical protein [Anaerolineaceae bacterium]
MTLTNQSSTDISLGFDLCALLNLHDSENNFDFDKTGFEHFLFGDTGKLSFVCLTTGKPKGKSSPYPSLNQEIQIEENGISTIKWVICGGKSIAEAFQTAEDSIQKKWDPEISRIELQNSSQYIHIQSGRPKWDTAFIFAQKTAYGLLTENHSTFINPSFVLNKKPDNGFSENLDASEYNHLWDGQTVFDTFYLANILLPGGKEIIKGMINNFLTIQTDNGFIDGKPGLAGQRADWLAQPLIATLAWEISKAEKDTMWLSAIYPHLTQFINVWFNEQNDKDQDGVPEWSNIFQTALDSSPIYSRIKSNSQSLDVRLLESPSLAAFLYKECQAIINIAEKLGRTQEIDWLEDKLNQLKAFLKSSWNKRKNNYLYRDYQNHQSTKSKKLMSVNGSGKFTINKSFSKPDRLHFNVKTEGESTRALIFKIIGSTLDGVIEEKATLRSFLWNSGNARFTTKNAFKNIDMIIIEGLPDTDQIDISTPDFSLEDISNFTPLWTDQCLPEEVRLLIKKRLLKDFNSEAGIPLAVMTSDEYNEISIPWNSIIIEGLILNGFYTEAAQFMTKLMDSISNNLFETHSFWEKMISTTGQPIGEKNHLHGLPPINTFLKTIGIDLISDEYVIIKEIFPYSWPITVKYKGVSITRNTEYTEIIYPKGKKLKISGPGPHKFILK